MVSPAAASERGEHVFVGADVVDDGAGLDHAGPAEEHRHAVAAFPLGVLLPAEHRRAAVRPAKGFGPVVGGIHHDGVLLEAECLELVEHLADVAIVFDHAIRIDAQAGLAVRFLLQVREDVHAGGVPPEEERLVRLLGALHEIQRLRRHFLVHGLHALAGERAGVGDAAVRKAVDHPTRTELLLELRALRVVGILRFFLGVQVVEVAEELVEAVRRGQHLVAVAQVVLAELPGDVALRLEQRGDGRVFLPHALGRTRQAHLREAGADGRLPGDEGGAAGGAALLAIPVGEQRAFGREAVNVRRPVAHHAAVVSADVELADVVSPDDQDVRLGILLSSRIAGQK